MGKHGNGGYNFLEKDLDKVEIIYGIGVGSDTSIHVDFLMTYPQIKKIHLYDHTVVKQIIPPLEKIHWQ